MYTMMIQMITDNLGHVIPEVPDHLHIRFLKWIAYMMDQYRDIRLVWTLVESVLMLIIVALIAYFIYRVRTVEGCLRAKYKSLDERVRQIAELHKRADELEKKENV